MNLLLTLASLVLIQDRVDQLTEEQLSVFAILDKVDPLDTTKLPFVKVFPGWVDEGRPRTFVAFLLKDEGATFTVRDFDGDRTTLTRSVKGTPDLERVHYEKAELVEYAKSLVRRIKEPDEDERHFYLGMSGVFEPTAEAVIVARACARRGLRAEVHGLWDVLALDVVLDRLDDGFRHRLKLDFVDPELTWTHLRDRHKAWIEAFGASEDRKDVESDLAMLDRMIKEDGERKKGDPIAELIYELRNERFPLEDQYFDGCYIGGGPPKVPDPTRPAERLVNLGHEAVSALIDSLEDDRFTRIVWYSSRYGGGYRITTVGSLAEDVLQKISGLKIYGEPDERKDGWKRWRKSVAEKGEEETLAGMVSDGGDLAVQAAEILIKKWPGRIDAILAGVGRMKEARKRVRMIELLEPLREEKVTGFLLEELKKGPETTTRVAAARLLLDRGRREGIEALSKEWNSPVEFKETTQEGLPPEILEFDKGIRQSQAREAISEFLLTSGDLAAVRTVAKDLDSAPSGLRRSVLDVLYNANLKHLLKRCVDKDRLALEKEFESMLIGFLEDKGRWIARSYGATTSPRQADLAALSLAEFWPHVYTFDATVPSRMRDRRMLDFIHGWKTRNGKEPVAPVPAPDRRSKDPAIPKRVAAFIAERNADLRKADGEGLETAGLGALPWIEDGLRKLAPDHPAKADLNAVANRLSKRVGSTRIETGAWKESGKVNDLLKALEGKTLTPDLAVKAMLDAMAAFPDQAGTVTLMVDRLGDGTGLHVEILMVLGESEGGTSSDGAYSVVIGGKSTGFSSGSGVRSVRDDVEDFGDFKLKLLKALDSPHDCTFEALYELEWK